RAAQGSHRRRGQIMAARRVLITGASGNLGAKLRRHLEGRYDLVLIDRDPRGDAAIHTADLSVWDLRWVKVFAGADTVIHLAADPVADRTWPEWVAPNLDAMTNAYEAAAQGKVRRFVFASSNHVMGGYQHVPDVAIKPDLPPLPGTEWTINGQPRRSHAYAAAKLFG